MEIIQVFIDGMAVPVFAGKELIVRERDSARLRVWVPDAAGVPRLFIGDQSYDLTAVDSVEGGIIYDTAEGPLFRECFGHALCRVEFGADQHTQLFNVLLRKIDAIEIEEMISYLFSKSADLIRVCLARSTIPIASLEHGEADPEALLAAADAFTLKLADSRAELSYHLRTRLVPVKAPEWASVSGRGGIEPYDVLMNLDALVPVAADGDVYVHGRHYSLAGIEVTTLHASVQVEENAVLVGGLYSIRRKLQVLLELLQAGRTPAHLAAFDKEHESLGCLLARVTTGHMSQRCEFLIERAEKLLHHFEIRLGIAFRGELRPRVTPFVRASRVYRPLFTALHAWYELGTPSERGLYFPSKLRTVSKIYEFFCLYRLIEFFQVNDWTVTQYTAQADGSEYIPAVMVFERGATVITLRYDTGVAPMHDNSEHMDLVDLKNNPGDPGTWYAPDFVLRLQCREQIRYLILDAKYSNKRTVVEERLPDILNKYFVNMGVYDRQRQRVTGDQILSVVAIYPGARGVTSIDTKWRTNGNSIFGDIVRYPMAAGVTLSSQDGRSFTRLLHRLIDVAVQTTAS